MLPVQDFCLANIYCAPNQDRSYSFDLVKVTRDGFPLRKTAQIYTVTKNLPNQTDLFHVFVIGNLFPSFINFLGQDRDWYRDVWTNFQDDMVARNFLARLYDDSGIVYPSANCYYSFIDEHSIVIAVKVDTFLMSKFSVDKLRFLKVYSNSYFQTEEFSNLPVRTGIDVLYSIPADNVAKVVLQNFIAQNEANGGKCLIFVDGYYTENLSLLIPDYSVVEIIYDQSIMDSRTVLINDLRTFTSTKDSKLKYLFFSDLTAPFIHYFDDNDIFIITSTQMNNKGLYFYQHNNYAVRNVTDKDYALYSDYVNNLAQELTNRTAGATTDKQVKIFIRKPGLLRSLKYSHLKLHELYKLPVDLQLNTLLGSGNALDEFRAENLENSPYFDLASLTSISGMTKELCTEVLGYDAITYYLGKSYLKTTGTNIDVPVLYQSNSEVFEYDDTGLFLGHYPTTGPSYILNNPTTSYVEFLFGMPPVNFDRYYAYNETITLLHNEYRVISAIFSGYTRLTEWVDITDDPTKVTLNGTSLTFSETDSTKKIKVVYFNQPNILDLDIPIQNGILYFPLTIVEDRGTGMLNQAADVPYTNIEIFLNGNKLTYGLDFFLKFPYLAICNKTYLDYTKEAQSIHIRMYGFTLDETLINEYETRGFVNNGVLTRNKHYDIRDDRNFAVFIDGKMYPRENVLYAENDSTVRLTSPLNGLPYTLKEPFTPIKQLTNLDTLPYYNTNNQVNTDIANFFDLVFPEPTIDETDIIADHHYLYSPLISKIIEDMLDGIIASTVYTTAYDDTTLTTFIDSDPTYSALLNLDPLKFITPNNIVEVHPHIGNVSINLNLFQYRFVLNLIRLFFNNQINISGYLTVSA